MQLKNGKSGQAKIKMISLCLQSFVVAAIEVAKIDGEIVFRDGDESKNQKLKQELMSRIKLVPFKISILQNINRFFFCFVSPERKKQ